MYLYSINNDWLWFFTLFVLCAKQRKQVQSQQSFYYLGLSYYDE